MKLRVARAKRRYKDKVYETPLVVTSYRDENGVARNKTVLSLAQMPDYLVDLIEQGLKRGDASALGAQVPIQAIDYAGCVVVGPSYVTLSILKQLHIYRLIQEFLPPQQATALLNIIVERVIAAKPLSVMAQQRRFPQEPLSFLLDQPKAPALNTWYSALASLSQHRETILHELFACFLAYRVVWELRKRWESVLERDPDNNRCEAGSLAEIWRELADITVAKLQVAEETHFKLSQVAPYAQKLLTMARVPNLDSILSE